MTVFLVLCCILLLVLLITWGKLNPFIAFLVVSLVAGLLLGIPFMDALKSVQKGMGDTLGSLVVIITLGAMLGKAVADSGAAQQIASTLMRVVGKKYLQWAMVATGFIVGLPLFYSVGFVLMVPLVFSVAAHYKLPLIYIGLPMLAALSVTHGFLPPHPSPVALVAQFHADMGLTLLYGMMVAIPAIIIAGPFFSRTLKHIHAVPLASFRTEPIAENLLPPVFTSFFVALLPIVLLMLTTVLPAVFPNSSTTKQWCGALGDPAMVMLIAVAAATFLLGPAVGRSIKAVMDLYAEAVKDIAMLLLIFAGAGALKQVLLDSGVSQQLAQALQSLQMPPLFLGWLIAAIIRVCLGSATVAGLTAAGIVLPLMAATGVNPNLMVLAVGAGSLMFSHVNDTGFWLFKEYFNLSVKDTIRSWSLMETIIAVVGLLGVLVLDIFVS